MPLNQEHVENIVRDLAKAQSSNRTLVPAAKRRRVVSKLSSEKLLEANIISDDLRVVSGSTENLSSNQERVESRNGIGLEKKRKLSNQELVPSAKSRSFVTRSSEMNLPDEKLVSVKSSGTSRTGSRTTKSRLVDDKRSFESLSPNKEILQLSNEIVNGEDAPIDFSKLSKSITEDFETYKRLFLKWKVTIVKEDVLSNSTCNCPAFGTEYICKHIVGLAIRMKLVTPPPEAKTIPIGEKRIPGRPSKIKPALMIQ